MEGNELCAVCAFRSEYKQIVAENATLKAEIKTLRGQLLAAQEDHLATLNSINADIAEMKKMIG